MVKKASATKKPTKGKQIAKKPAMKDSPAELLRKLVQLIPKDAYDEFTREAKDLFSEAAKLVGSSRFVGGFIEIDVSFLSVDFKNLLDDDSSFQLDIKVINKRTGEVAQVEDVDFDLNDVVLND